MSDELTDPVVDEIKQPEEVEEETQEVVDDSLDTAFTAAQNEYRARMEAIGAEFDASGTFIRFKSTMQTEQPAVATDEFGGNDELEQLRREVFAETKPVKITSIVTSIVSRTPKLGRYEAQVRQLLDQIDPTLINEKVVESYFHWARGQAADIEIVEAVKEDRVKRTGKIVEGAAAVSESAGGAPVTQGKKAVITPEIAKYAREFKIDPQKLADKLAAKRKAEQK